MKWLAVETSCDETAVALAQDEEVLLARVASQEVHARWGGVVPELASRLHQKTLARMVPEALAEAGWRLGDLDGVAATRGPGLIGALLVGVSYAKGVAVADDIPFVGVNHLEGHLWSGVAAGQEMPLPSLGILVSGGHTELIRIDGFGEYTLLGATLDDAIGEAFDKVGGLLGLTYPAGAALSEMALKGDPGAHAFSLPQTRSPLDFSYSGLKSAVARVVQQSDTLQKNHLAAAFEEIAVRQIVNRAELAMSQGSYRSVLLGGGVAANGRLRNEMELFTAEHGVDLLLPPIELCTDNAAMIAYVAQRSYRERGADPLTLEADPNLKLLDIAS